MRSSAVERCPDKTEVPGSIPGAPTKDKMRNNRIPTIVFLTGKPASGKDTQAKFISEKFDFEVITTSNELKNFFKNYKKKYIKINNTKINIRKQKRNLEKGFLVAFRLVSYLLLGIIKEKIRRNKSLIFAGSPRTVFEARQYLNFLRKQKNIKFYFFYLKISNETAINRALERKDKRPDDILPVIKRRLKVFNQEVKPVIDWLRKQRVLIEINGEQSPEKVFAEILKYLK